MDEDSDSYCCVYYDIRYYSTSIYQLMNLAEHYALLFLFCGQIMTYFSACSHYNINTES